MGVSFVRAFSTGTIVATYKLIKVTDFSRRVSLGIQRHVTNKVSLINALSIWLFFILLKDYKFNVTKLHQSVLYMVWLSPGGSGGCTGISWDAEICPGFRPPRATLSSG